MTSDERCGSARWLDGKPGEDEWGERPDPAVIFEERLRARLEELCEEEWAVSLSYRRRFIQDRIDLIGVDLVQRGGVASPAEGLAPVLLGGGRHGGGVS